MRLWVAPCGLWQVVQESVTGSCSHKKGPRFSAWQLVQVSLTDAFASKVAASEPSGFMATAASHQPFGQRMMTAQIDLGAFSQMTTET